MFENYKDHHYIGRLFSRINLPPIVRAVAVAVASYVLFWLLSGVGGTELKFTSFLHVWQFFLSLTLFFAVWFADLALSGFKPWLESIRTDLRISTKDYKNLVKKTFLDLSNKKAFLLGIPFALPGLVVAFIISSTLPNELFPFEPGTVVFIYVVFIQLCLLMLHLLGDTGFWYLWVLTRASKRLGEIDSLDVRYIDEESVKRLSRHVLRVCFWLFVLLAAGMPGIAYVGNWFGGVSRVIVFSFGVFLPVVGLVLSYFGPTYYLNRILKTAHAHKIKRLKEQLRVCDQTIEKMLFELGDKVSKSSREKYGDLAEISMYLHRKLEHLEEHRGGPFDFSSIVQLLGSASIPVFAYFTEQIITQIIENGL